MMAPDSTWQNGFAERLIGSIRRECVDHIIVLGEAHLRRILKNYDRYYNECRTHLSLNKDAPLSRAVQLDGRITANPVFARDNVDQSSLIKVVSERVHGGRLQAAV